MFSLQNKMADGGLKNVMNIQLLSCQASESPPSPLLLSSSLSPYTATSTFSQRVGLQAGRYTQSYSLSMHETARGTTNIIFPGLTRPVGPGSTRPPPHLNHAILTCLSLDPACLPLRSYPSAVPSDVITFLAHQTSAGIL